jgi:hypothetical protein
MPLSHFRCEPRSVIIITDAKLGKLQSTIGYVSLTAAGGSTLERRIVLLQLVQRSGRVRLRIAITPLPTAAYAFDLVVFEPKSFICRIIQRKLLVSQCNSFVERILHVSHLFAGFCKLKSAKSMIALHRRGRGYPEKDRFHRASVAQLCVNNALVFSSMTACDFGDAS